MSQNLNVTLQTKKIRIAAAITVGLFSSVLQTMADDAGRSNRANV